MARLRKTDDYRMNNYLTVLEERGRTITALERETEAQAEQLQRQSEEVIAARAEAKKYQNYWNEERGRTANLQHIIANTDPTKMQAAMGSMANDHKNEMTVLNHTIRQLREDLHRCLGWIDARLEKHPIEPPPVSDLPKKVREVHPFYDAQGRLHT